MKNSKFDDNELLKSYEKNIKKTTNIKERQNLEYNIEYIKTQNEFEESHILNLKLPYDKLQSKIYKETELLNKYTEKLKYINFLKSKKSWFMQYYNKKSSEEIFLQTQIPFIKNKLFFLKQDLKPDSAVYETTKEVSGINGTIIIDIVKLKASPIKRCKSIQFYIDNVFRKEITYNSIETVELECKQASEFEMIIITNENKIFDLLCVTCDFFKTKSSGILYRFNMKYAYMHAKINFKTNKNFYRNSARIIEIDIFKHKLKAIKHYIPHCCAICKQFVSNLTPIYTCQNCKLACHKFCSNSIIIYCKTESFQLESSKTLTLKADHCFIKSQSLKSPFCMHCGLAIKPKIECLSCKQCSLSYHLECETIALNDCSISLACRKEAFGELKKREKRPIKSLTHIDDFKFEKMLGKGSFGTVWLVKHIKARQNVALKVFKKEIILDENSISYLEIEKDILEFTSRQHECKFLLKMTHCSQDEFRVFFGTEYLPGGDLLHLINKMNSFTHNMSLQYTSEILLGLEFLHKNNIIFRDLKLENIFLTADGHCKIGDFGLAKPNVDKIQICTTFCGTINTMAPEIFATKKYTRIVDYWSLGIIIYSMYEGVFPFEGYNDDEIINSILEKPVMFKKLKSSEPSNKNAILLIQNLLTKEPQKRLGSDNGCKDIKKHMYFKSLNWDDVSNGKLTPEYLPDTNVSNNFDEEFLKANPEMSICKPEKENDALFIAFY